MASTRERRDFHRRNWRVDVAAALVLTLLLCAIPREGMSREKDSGIAADHSVGEWLGSDWDDQAGHIHFFIEHRLESKRGYVRGCAVLPDKQVVRSPLVPVTHDSFGGAYPRGICGAALDDRSRAYILVQLRGSDPQWGVRGKCTQAVWILDLHEQRYLGEVSWPEDDRLVFAVAPIPGTSCLLEQSLHLFWDPQKDGPPPLRLRVVDSRYEVLWQSDYAISRIPNERPPNWSPAHFVRDGKSGVVHIAPKRIEVRCTGVEHPVVIEPSGEDGAWMEVERFPKG